jgi:hypothetical protein
MTHVLATRRSSDRLSSRMLTVRGDDPWPFPVSVLESPIVTSHQIAFTLPTTELGSQDIVFEVFIDGTKEGSLRISTAGLDWHAKAAKTRTAVKTWSQLRDFMESDTEISSAAARENFWFADTLVDDLDGLLSLTNCESLEEVQELLSEARQTHCELQEYGEEDEDGDWNVFALGVSTGPGVVQLDFPFPLSDLWSYSELGETSEDSGIGGDLL